MDKTVGGHYFLGIDDHAVELCFCLGGASEMFVSADIGG